MGRLPVLKPREVIALLAAYGFVEARQQDSHKQFRHADECGTTVAVHQRRDISPILLRKIADDIGMTVQKLLNQQQNFQSLAGRRAAAPGAAYGSWAPTVASIGGLQSTKNVTCPGCTTIINHHAA